jgi:hypothetical protein
VPSKQPWPPDGKYHWTWLENHHRPYTQFRAVSDARYAVEIWFDRIVRQACPNLIVVTSLRF